MGRRFGCEVREREEAGGGFLPFHICVTFQTFQVLAGVAFSAPAACCLPPLPTGGLCHASFSLPPPELLSSQSLPQLPHSLSPTSPYKHALSPSGKQHLMPYLPHISALHLPPFLLPLLIAFSHDPHSGPALSCGHCGLVCLILGFMPDVCCLHGTVCGDIFVPAVLCPLLCPTGWQLLQQNFLPQPHILTPPTLPSTHHLSSLLPSAAFSLPKKQHTRHAIKPSHKRHFLHAVLDLLLGLF